MADVKAQSGAVGGGRPSEEHIVNLVSEFVGDAFAIVGHRNLAIRFGDVSCYAYTATLGPVHAEFDGIGEEISLRWL